MKTLFICFVCLGIFVHPTDAQVFEWVKSFKATEAKSITVDKDGNVYSTGNFTGLVDFDPGAGTENLTASSDEIYVQKLDPNGNFVWVKHMAGGLSCSGVSIATDGSGNVYTIGYFRGTVDFDPGSGTMNITSMLAGKVDAFIQKLDPSGNLIWIKRIGPLYDDFGLPLYIDVDESGNVYTAGLFEGFVDFDPGNAEYSLLSTDFFDTFIQKLDNSGNFVWAHNFGGSAAAPSSISVDGQGNVFVSGYFSGTIIVGPAGNFSLATAKGITDIFVEKLDPSGNLLWSQPMGGSGDDYARGLALDNSGNAYITGFFQQTADFNIGGTASTLTSAGQTDVFVKKVNTNGELIWLKHIGGTGGDEANAIAVGPSGELFITGFFAGSADFNMGGPAFHVTSKSARDVFILTMDGDGKIAWVSTTPLVQVSSITSDDGKVILAGLFSGIVDFDPGPGAANQTSTMFSVYILKLDATPVVVGLLPIEAKTFSVFPNPCVTHAYVNVEKTSCSNKISVRDVNNRIVLTLPAEDGDKRTLEMDSLPRGMYFVEVTNSDGLVTTSRLMKE